MGWHVMGSKQVVATLKNLSVSAKCPNLYLFIKGFYGCVKKKNRNSTFKSLLLFVY